MAIYEIENNKISKISTTTFSKMGLKERSNLQCMLREQMGSTFFIYDF
jgi:hypothetical protein